VSDFEALKALQAALKAVHREPSVLTEAQELTVSRLQELIPADEYQAGVIDDAVSLIYELESRVSEYRDSGYRRQ
jgi:hypothetical protein